MNAKRPYENRLYNGSYNLLQVSQRMKVKYNCKFDVYKFPFDGEICYLIFKINRYKNAELTFVQDGPVIYNGPVILNEFEIGFITSKIENTQKHTKFILSIPLNRIFTHQLLKTFIPTVILWLLGYFTMFIDTENPGDRFKGAVTMMLVLATWIGVISGDLPKTSYVKLIDCWLLWHFVTTFVISFYHIFLDRMGKQSINTTVTEVRPCTQGNGNITMKIKYDKDQIDKFNRNIIVVFFCVNCIFYGIYLVVSFQ